ncbi:hypothetical protein PHMEG_00023336 [Phytophthora megakarya]|uniref:Uncharacterized protein n=1 Tax=Phytophthora megakarya TaxID=4795 RepID=A0A225VGH0_9STRA|nr:hypothetical protein PHMEG_00023336 [Phytophthora megakarya]
MCNRDDLIGTNSNFIDSEATMNTVSPEFCERTGLRDSTVLKFQSCWQTDKK